MLAHAQVSLLSATSRTCAFEPDFQAAATVRGISECNWDENCSLQATLESRQYLYFFVCHFHCHDTR
jgi:hypothetical protein